MTSDLHIVQHGERIKQLDVLKGARNAQLGDLFGLFTPDLEALIFGPET
jgi:hypothetical protein